jgi:WD40 repeat protein
LGGPQPTDIDGNPLPDRALVRFGTLRYRIGDFRAVAISPDGKLLAIANRADFALWDVDTGRPVARVPAHEFGDPISLSISPDDTLVAYLSDSHLHVIDAKSGQRRMTLALRNTARAAAFVPATGRIALSQGNGDVSFIDPADGNVERELESAESAYLLSPGGRFFLGRSDETLHLIDARSGLLHCRIELDDPHNEILSEAVTPGNQFVAILPDDRRMYAVTVAGRLRSFDTETGRAVDDLDPPPGWHDVDWYTHLALSPDGSVAYLAKSGQATHRRDLKAGRWLDPLPPLPDGRIFPHPDGKRLLVAGSDGVLHRYDLRTRREILEPLGFDHNVQTAASPDGRRVAISSGGSNGRLDMFDADGRYRRSVPIGPHPGPPRWSLDGRVVACTGSDAVVVCDAGSGSVRKTLRAPDRKLEFTGLLRFDPSGARLTASLNNGEALAVFDLAVGGPARVVRPGVRWVTDVSPDGRTAVFTNGSPGPALFDKAAERFRVGWTFPPPPRQGCGGGGNGPDDRSIQFSPDGLFLVSWEDDGLVVLWSAATGEPLRTFPTGNPFPSAWTLSADGLWLAIGSGDGRLSLFDVPTGTELVEWQVPGRGIRDLSFAGPGRLVVSCADTTVVLWDLRPRKKLSRPVWDALNDDEDPADSFRAIWALATDLDGASVLRSRIAPIKPAPAGPVCEWIRQLGADRFAVREEASNVLLEFGRRIEPELPEARKQMTSEEVRARLDAILSKLPPEREWDEVVHARAVAAMELAGTPAAKKLLAEWAGGAAGARLTVDAKAALIRLGETK